MLRSIIAASVILLMAGTASAATSPIDKGSLYLGGSIYYQHQSGDLWEDDGDAITSYGAGNAQYDLGLGLEASMTVGYFIAPNLLVGAQLAYINFHMGKSDYDTKVFGPTVGYFFNPRPERTEVKGALYPYLRGYFSWGEGTFKDDYTILQFGGKGGVLYMISRAVAADANLRVQRDSWDENGPAESADGTTISFGVGITTFIY